MDLILDYVTLKSLIGSLVVYYAERADASIDIWCFPAWGDTNSCVISDPADIADFNANLKPTATAVDGPNAAAAIENNKTGGRRATKEQPYTKSGRNFIVTGSRFEVPLGATTDCDTSFAEERELQGARLCVKDPTDGDYVDFEVVHPDPSIGVILTWAETIYVKPGSGFRDEYITGDSRTLPAGLILRLVYHSAGIPVGKSVIYIDFLGWR